ncbi:serine incorporator/TMS membrane protein [Phakopsora pachyrhizi]|uniref:Serine incorporator/TMS membrane protein n=1 Tax=Phakopsora pachyrhizi TaxID=170000 RepID=A0AAV0BQN3_PHAPC|nr:serine incorporator/TMS membrane protein [Phakopsora pachyrhizi]
MGALLSIPLLGTLTGLVSTIGLSCLSGLVFFCSSQAASAFCKTCNFSSSIATRIAYCLILILNSLFAWIMLTPFAIEKLESWSYELFHSILALLLMGVTSTRQRMSVVQNGYWGPKILVWLALVLLTFFIPNGFFMFYSRYVAWIGSLVFIFFGLILLIEFAYVSADYVLGELEVCQERTDWRSRLWEILLIGLTLSMHILTLVISIVDLIFFGGSGCGLNRFFIIFNLILCLIVTGISLSRPIQEVNPRLGIIQPGVVVIYCTQLVTSAIANHDDGDSRCNPLTKLQEGAETSMVVLGALMTLVAIAYTTFRAGTKSFMLTGASEDTGYVALEESDPEQAPADRRTPISRQPSRKDPLRIQAIRAAVQEGSLPASALEDELRQDSSVDEVAVDDDDDDDEEGRMRSRDDETIKVRYHYTSFHITFALATMYVAMLLTHWNIVSHDNHSPDESGSSPVKIGRSTATMWMRIISGWVCLLLYGWTLVAPILLPDSFS